MSFDFLKDHTIVLTFCCLQLVQELGDYPLSFEQGLIQMGLFHSILQRVPFLCADSHGAGHIELVFIQDDLDIELATVMYAVNNYGH